LDIEEGEEASVRTKYIGQRRRTHVLKYYVWMPSKTPITWLRYLNWG